MSARIPAGLQGPVRQQALTLQEQFPDACITEEPDGGFTLTSEKCGGDWTFSSRPGPLPEGLQLLIEHAEAMRDSIEEAGLEGEVTLGKLCFPTRGLRRDPRPHDGIEQQPRS
ncbi:hypothetical protein [Candidatus Palauibacter sp.]|uniref:hypothetical protein n=1 Tax=Candidatus Palauibacter sp. TaxID=3101350 RepID=UPI003B02E5E5